MNSGHCMTLEGGRHPSPHFQTTHQPQYHDMHAEPVPSPGNEETAEPGGKKRKRSGRRGRPSDDQNASADKPRRERANFNAAQLYALERLFQDQQYPDGDLRIRIAERLDLNEERVQIWFQNRRAKQKRLQREGTRQVTDENSPQTARDYSQPSSIDYIPPQLDEDMLGPSPTCIVPSCRQTNATGASTPLRPTDLNPGPATAPFANSCQYHTTTTARAQSSRCDFVPFPNGANVAERPHHQTHQSVTRSNCQLPAANSSAVCQEVSSGETRNGMHHNVATTQGVGKSNRSASVNQACLDGKEPLAGSGTHLGNMSQAAAEPWRTANGQAGPGGDELFPRSRATNAECQALRVTSLVAVSSSCSQRRKHRGEAPCRKDQCITCREKPPPNQVCTALPDGQRNELDEALYRCAVGSIIGIDPLTSPLNSRNNSTSHVPEPASTDSTPLKLSAYSKPTKGARENPVSTHRRLAMVRKQRQMEKDYPSSSSDSPSDSDEETDQPKRRRKVARRTDQRAPPNRICTAVPLMDRTLPLPCLTKDLSLDSFLEDTVQSKHPTTRDLPSCLPSPLSAGRLSSPEPQSSASEQHGYSSSSSSDVSDYEYILPSSTPRQSVLDRSEPSQGDDSINRAPTICAGNSSAVPCSRPSVAGGTDTMSLDAISDSQRDKTHNYKPYQPFMPGPGQESIRAQSCTYPIGGPRHSSEEIDLNRPQGVFSSVPPPFEVQQDPVSVPETGSSDKQGQAVYPSNTSSATAENRRNQTYEILAESRFVGELCGSPVSPWSDPGLQSSFKSTSPQQPHHHGQPNDPRVSPFHGGMPARPTRTNYTAGVNGTAAHQTNYVPFAARFSNNGASMNHRPPLLAGTHQDTFNPIRSHYPHTSSMGARPSTFNEPMERQENVFSSNDGNAYNNFPQFRNIQHAPILGTTGDPGPYPETHPYVNGHSDFTSHNMNTHRPANYPLAPPPLNGYHSSNISQPWTAHFNHHLPFDGFSSHY